MLPNTTTLASTAMTKGGICGGAQIFVSAVSPVATNAGLASRHQYLSANVYGIRETSALALQGARGMADFKWSLGNVATQRVFIGVSTGILGTSNVGSDTPAEAYVALQYSTARGDTTWQAIRCPTVGGAQQIVDTLITVDTSVLSFCVKNTADSTYTLTVRDAAGATLYTDTIVDGPDDTHAWAETWVVNNLAGTLIVDHYGLTVEIAGS